MKKGLGTFRLLQSALLGATLCAAFAPGALASSHREAPFVAGHPQIDATDFYMFNSYETGRSGYVTIIANYLPLQDAYGGPNYFALDPDALYEIHIDNNGDAKEDLTFQFRFSTQLLGGTGKTLPIGSSSVAIPLINFGGIAAGNNAALNRLETYTLTMVRGDRRTGTPSTVTNAADGTATFTKPVDNIGNKSIPDYNGYSNQYIYNVSIPGCTPPAGSNARVFVGQRKDPFYVNLGEVFDLINFNPVGARNSRQNVLANKNVTSLALEVPASCLNAGGTTIIGGWTTASLRQARLIDGIAPTFTTPAKEGGAWTQVSRLGMPLVNELVIGLKDKNLFNSSKPVNDGQFATYVTNPTLPALIQILYSVPPPAVPRNDLVAVFLTGVASVNQPANVVASEMLRLNTALPATAAASQNDLGALQCFVNGTLTLSNPGCDPAGFPNGRRPIDDVVDIALRAAEGALNPAGANHPAAADLVNDGAQLPGAAAGTGASDFNVVFPYFKAPVAGSPYTGN
jgi:Domain of unknown function (DUF4331)